MPTHNGLWIEWLMVVVGLWYGQRTQVHFIDGTLNAQRYMTRSWGPLLCHSSMTITSCCSMIMHGPMLQGSVHNSRKLKTSQFLHGQHALRTCHPLSMFGMLWIRHIYDTYTTIPANIRQLRTAIEEEWTNIPQATINNLINSMRRRCEANGGHTRYWLLYLGGSENQTAHFRVAFYCGQPKVHLCNTHAV